MKFVLATSIAPVADDLTETILARLAQGRVLWLVSGGSCIRVAVAAADRLRAGGWPLSDLTVSLADERYGAVGHPDSNWAQLEAAGFSLPGAKLKPILFEPATAAQATERFAGLLERHLGQSFCLALLGIGADGHTAGIKPRSPAVSSSSRAVSYDWDDYRRITITGRALGRLNQAIVYAAGEAKWPLVAALQTADAPPAAAQPAQFLRQIPQVAVFTDRPETSA